MLEELKKRFDILTTEILFNLNKQKVQNGEKIKIVFLFQIASFWPSWETFYIECLNDERLDVKMVLYDIIVAEKAQTKTARTFLESNNIDFIELNNYDIDTDKPHIIVMQTPYETNHRLKNYHSYNLKAKGIRPIYISYGIEISDTDFSRNFHFGEGVPLFAWRIYTYSNLIKQDYKLYSPRGVNAIEEAVRPIGHPKFDGLYNFKNFELSEHLINKIKGRKIVLWKAHFPKLIKEVMLKKNMKFMTPEISEYEKFIAQITNYHDLFFIFMPHPKFFEQCLHKRIYSKKQVDNLKSKLNELENVYSYYEDDYRPALLNADAIIVDRSAVMVEAAVTKKPILYMYNKNLNEPLTKVTEGIVNTYYLGTTCENMINFIEMFKKDEDPKKEERLAAIKEFIPNFDGSAGKRIKEDMINSILSE